MDVEERIKEEIEKIRPFLQGDGGDIEFASFEDGIVHVKLSGACAGCSMIDYTLKDGVEEILVNEIPEVKAVVNDTDTEMRV
jgi:Fe-S cluster biogenesis protein NfuA